MGRAEMNTLYLCPAGLSLLQYIKKKERYETLAEFLDGALESELYVASAELNSLFRMGVAKGDRVVFLSSDTDDGEETAKALARFFEEKKGCNVLVQRIVGLQTGDRAEFDKAGIPNLTDAIIGEIQNNRYYYNIVLNATAGFKATVPYLTFIGMVFHLPIRYIFERSQSIIELPSMPIEFDMERLKRLESVIDRIMSDYMSVDEFRATTGCSYDEMKQDTEDILLEEDGYLTIRPVGRILYQRYLHTKGNKVYLSATVLDKMGSGHYDSQTFESLFRKMKDPVHLQSKLHPEIKRQGQVDLECYKAGSTSERIFFYSMEKKIYVCEIFMHDEYERVLSQGGLLRAKYENKGFTEA